jgi:hypothetical protein
MKTRLLGGLLFLLACSCSNDSLVNGGPDDDDVEAETEELKACSGDYAFMDWVDESWSAPFSWTLPVLQSDGTYRLSFSKPGVGSYRFNFVKGDAAGSVVYGSVWNLEGATWRKKNTGDCWCGRAPWPPSHTVCQFSPMVMQ